MSASSRSHVYAQFAADRTNERRVRRAQVDAQLASLDPLAEEIAPSLLVPAPLRDELLSLVALQVPPLADEHGCRSELLGDDAEVPAQRLSDPLDRVRVVVDGVEGGVEGLRARPGPRRTGAAASTP